MALEQRKGTDMARNFIRKHLNAILLNMLALVSSLTLLQAGCSSNDLAGFDPGSYLTGADGSSAGTTALQDNDALAQSLVHLMKPIKK